MYDKLIKNLRHDSVSALQNCEFDFVHAWMLEAADAIEELLDDLRLISNDTDTAIVKEGNATYLRFVKKWIPVTERLPEYGEKCLVVFKLHSHNDFYIGISYCYVQKEGFWSDCGRDYKVTHWMPLPQPPESEGEP